MTALRPISNVPAIDAYLRGLADAVVMARGGRVHPASVSAIEEAVNDWIARVRAEPALLDERLALGPPP
jgi:hypothetical protein